MSEINEALARSAIGRELAELIARERYARGLAKKSLAILRPAFEDVATTLVTKYSRLGPSDRAGLAALYADVRRLLNAGYKATGDALLQEFGLLQRLEADRALAEVAGAGSRVVGQVRLLTSAQLSSIAKLPIEGHDLGSWWSRLAESATARTRQQVQLGLTLGEGPRDLARRIISADVQGSAPMVWRVARRDAVSIARTATTAVQNDAALSAYRAAGGDVVPEVQFRAVLDARTTPICRKFDGKRFRVDDPQLAMATPPLHINCRSILAPVANVKALGVRGKVEGVGPASWSTYEGWLRSQAPAVQNAVLGPGRAALWRDHGVTLEQFVAGDGATLTLDQLKSTYAKTTPVAAPPVVSPRDRFEDLLREAAKMEDAGGSSFRGSSYEWAKEQIDEFLAAGRARSSELSDDFLNRAVKAYQGTGYGDVNDALRENPTLPLERLKKMRAYPFEKDVKIEQVVRALDNSAVPAPRDVVVYRGARTADPLAAQIEQYGERMVGQQFTDHGYTSTSTSMLKASNFATPRAEGSIIYRLVIEKGTRVIPVDGYTRGADSGSPEFELALPRGRTFRVLRVGATFLRGGSKTRFVDLEIVP